jgi:hypothetical protein
MKIAAIEYYSGARQKICRLGLSDLYFELQDIIFKTEVKIKKEQHANSGAVVRELIDLGFSQIGGWVKTASGDIDWVKRIRYNDSIIARLGIEIQVSGRSELMIKDILHIRKSIQSGDIDAGILVVPSDEFAYYLTDRVPSYSYALEFSRNIAKEAQDYPIVIIGIEQDGFSEVALPKKRTNLGA